MLPPCQVKTWDDDLLSSHTCKSYVIVVKVVTEFPCLIPGTRCLLHNAKTWTSYYIVLSHW